MKQCLADVNVLLALLVASHEHHGVATRWFDDARSGEVTLCRPVQLTLIRLLGNPAVVGKRAISGREAWNVIENLLTDERIVFVPEPEKIDSVFPVMLRYSKPTHKLVADAWLAAFAIASKSRFVTFDRGFQQFKGLALELLHP